MKPNYHTLHNQVITLCALFKKLAKKIIAYNVSVLYDVADFQQKAQYEALKFELVKMFNRSTSADILYSTC